MTEREFDLIPLLDYIDPSVLSYQEWVNVGMALKQEGYTAMDWDTWSQADKRYKKGECFAKWDTFQGNGLGTVTGATITLMAKDNGWTSDFKMSDDAHELGWNDTIDRDYKIVDKKLGRSKRNQRTC